METKKHIIFSTDIFRYTYNDYLEWCEMNDTDPIYAEDSTEFFDWCHEQVEQDIECDEENIRYSEYYKRKFMITGTLGLWNGRPTIEPVIIDGLLDAINKCVSGNSIWDYDVFINDDEDYITVHAKHHDGTNVFELHLLTDEGYQEYEDAYDAWIYDNAPKPQLKSEWFEKILFNKIF